MGTGMTWEREPYRVLRGRSTGVGPNIILYDTVRDNDEYIMKILIYRSDIQYIL